MTSLSAVTKQAAPQPIFKVSEHIVQACHIREYPRALADLDDDDLKLAVKQYTPLDNLAPHKGDVTIIGAHANGFPKELYEPLWEEIYHRLRARGLNIRHIFIADVTCQGQSGVLNESKLGNDPSWIDAARDLLMVINHSRADIKQPIIGVGHSMGANVLVQLGHMHARLFTSLILIEPIIGNTSRGGGVSLPAAASARRRDIWPSQAAAEEAFRKSKFYQSWDSRVLGLLFKYGFRSLPTLIFPDAQKGKNDEKGVTLTTTKHQEVFSFLRPCPSSDGSSDAKQGTNLPARLAYPDVDLSEVSTPFYRSELPIAFSHLPTLRPSVLYVYGGRSTFTTAAVGEENLANTGIAVGGSGGVKEGRVKGVTMKKSSHLIPMENVNELADHCSTWMAVELGRWAEDAALLRQEWDKVPRIDKRVLPDSYAKTLNDEATKFLKTLQNKSPVKL